MSFFSSPFIVLILFLPHFDVIYDLLLNRHMAMKNLLILISRIWSMSADWLDLVILF